MNIALQKPLQQDKGRQFAFGICNNNRGAGAVLSPYSKSEL